MIETEASPLDNFQSIPDCIKGLKPSDAFAMVTGPGTVQLYKVDGEGRLSGPNGAPDLASLYEVTVFCDAFQARFLRNGMGATVEIIRKPAAASGLEDIEGKVLVWGKVDSVKDDWCSVSSARIGQLKIPAPVGAKAGDRLAFTTREIIRQYADGNMAVEATMLTGIVVYNAKENV